MKLVETYVGTDGTRIKAVRLTADNYGYVMQQTGGTKVFSGSCPNYYLTGLSFWTSHGEVTARLGDYVAIDIRVFKPEGFEAEYTEEPK